MVVHHGAFFCSTGSISRDGERVKSERNADVAWGEKGNSPGQWGGGGVGGVMGNAAHHPLAGGQNQPQLKVTLPAKCSRKTER